ncbi:ABC transporter G family member 23 [Folsomia candida]|uniref:ABC transporter G family member 23 n=1 Tax=Folsomia candida TaxID=158441 RepID=A0A226CYW7_FOLCA|nr:ABC transporter G family member 23 [Folsomia candida]
MSGFAALNIVSATKAYANKVVLHGVDIKENPLISCIVGIQQLHEGRVEIFRKNVTNFKNGMPGSLIGYMPQENALYRALTIMETFTYYGRLHGIPSPDVLRRVETLRNVMNLPNMNSRVEQISGGEQRRVSLCVALLHDPEILLLDEPTTGIDPLLRERIWDYLRLLVESKGTTVFVTTHYVQETRQCKKGGNAPFKSYGGSKFEIFIAFLDVSENSKTLSHFPPKREIFWGILRFWGKIGYLRDGSMLVQDSPKALLEKYGPNCTTALDDVQRFAFLSENEFVVE